MRILHIHLSFLFDFLSDFSQIGFHAFGILLADNVEQFIEFGSDTSMIVPC